MSRTASYARAIMVASAVGCVLTAPADAQLKAEKVPSYEAAKIIATTAVEACQAKGFHVSATVVNRDGDTIVQLRGDGARPHTVENSRRKVRQRRSAPIGHLGQTAHDGDLVVRQQVTLVANIPHQFSLQGVRRA